jgi:UDP:flavonoid glycosyltransferase YjiC (YdhE family)
VIPSRRRVLVAPLDWGLGHATRCIPLIRELISLDYEVFIAAEGNQKALLAAEFPTLTFLGLDGYQVQLDGKKNTAWKLIRQIPKIMRAIRQEKQWLAHHMVSYQFNLVISDNRYGLYHPAVKSTFITHQLRIKTGLGRLADSVLQKLHYRFIHRFTACWVPDFAETMNLAGSLSHPQRLPSIPVHYLGALSRFEKDPDIGLQYDLLFLLSGPEPQRSHLHEIILKELAHFPGKAVFVSGQPHINKPATLLFERHLHYTHLPAQELAALIQRSRYVISRSGYTTVMDLVKLQQKSILIPTPGQPEQEYLAQYLTKKGLAFSVPQRDFSLRTALAAADAFVYRFPFSPQQMEQYKQLIRAMDV